jgi:SAM-dependent methyltransferase
MQTLTKKIAPANPLAAHWNAAAAGWDANTPIIRTWLRTSTDAMINMANIAEGMHVLDIAAGAGDQSLDIAAKVGPGGIVEMTDFSADILELAEAAVKKAGLKNIRAIVADAENLPFDGEQYDAAVCRLGLMLFPHPERALAEMHRVLKPGARASVLVFSTIEANPCLSVMMSVAAKRVGLAPPAPDMPGSLVSLGKPGLVSEMFGNAGFGSVVSTRISAPFNLPTASHYVKFVRDSGAPIVHLMAQLDQKARDHAWAEIEDKLSAFNTIDGWCGPNELLLATGAK